MRLQKPVSPPTEQTNKRTYVVLTLDDSASMSSVRMPTLNGFNEQLQSLKGMAAPDHEVLVAVYKFSDPSRIELLRDFTDVREVAKLSENEYTANGGSTALLDTMNKALNLVQSKDEDICTGQNAALVVFFTDGMENSSREIGNKIQIKDRIEKLAAKKHYTFSYMGVGNLDEIASGYGFAKGNVTQFHAGPAGAAFNATRNTRAFASYNASRTLGDTSVKSFYDSTKTDDDEDDNSVTNLAQSLINSAGNVTNSDPDSTI